MDYPPKVEFAFTRARYNVGGIDEGTGPRAHLGLRDPFGLV